MNKQTHRPDLKLCSTVGLEEHCLGSKGAASPLDNVAVQLKEELISTNPDIPVENEEPGRDMFVKLTVPSPRWSPPSGEVTSNETISNIT